MSVIQVKRFDLERVSESDVELLESVTGGWVDYDDYTKLESQLTAEREAREKLDETLELMTFQRDHWKQRAEFAEARVKELERLLSEARKVLDAL